MAGWQSQQRKMDQAFRRQEREAVRARKELEKRRKEAEKLNEQERARLEVESYTNEIDVLLSIHKECREKVDWMQVFCLLPPCSPPKLARQEIAVAFEIPPVSDRENKLFIASIEDEKLLEQAVANVETEYAQWQNLHSLAEGILKGDAKAYSRAIADLAPFGEIDQLGSSMRFVIHDAYSVECSLTVNGYGVIPKQVKSLTTSKKLSVKDMPRGRFNEIYQDYVCGSVLRVARELFALLPLRQVLVNAVIEGINPADGQESSIPVLSVRFEKEKFDTLQFDSLDPSDSMSLFEARGDVMASRKNGTFSRVEPVSFNDFQSGFIAAGKAPITQLIAQSQSLRLVMTTVSSRISSH